MKIAICDDDRSTLEELNRYIAQYAARFLYDYQILTFENGGDLLEAVRADGDIRILFLDIYMKPLSGVDLAKILRSEGCGCAIIFVTTSTDHYAESYEIKAEHYLVKPITCDRVSEALSRCERVLRRAAKCAVFSAGSREILVPLRQLRYAEVFHNRIILHASDDISLRATLEAVARQIDDRRFLRTHRSFLVNMEYIAERDGPDILLKTGERVPLSRTCEKNYEREYGRFLTDAMSGEE